MATLMVAVGDISLDAMATARLEMEAVCCKLAAEHRTEAQLDAMRRELELQRDAGLNDEDFCASDVRFHRTLVDASGNTLLQFLMHAVVEALQPVSNMIIFRVRDRQAIVGFHDRILHSVESRDAETGTAALADLMAYTRERYREALERRAERTG